MTDVFVCPASGCFNPRARGGRDYLFAVGVWAFEVSIHAPAGGATVSELAARHALNVSIHAPAGGATHDQFADVLIRLEKRRGLWVAIVTGTEKRTNLGK